MYWSDYPHAESRFPESTNKVLAWQSLGSESVRKIFWDSPKRCFGNRDRKTGGKLLIEFFEGEWDEIRHATQRGPLIARKTFQKQVEALTGRRLIGETR